jgi:hypothetical protein
MILVPLCGKPRDRAALAAARRIDGPFRARITGLFARPDMVEALAMLQGSDRKWSTGAARAAGNSWGDPAALARRALEEARAGAAIADRPTGTDTVTARWLAAKEPGARLLVTGGCGAILIRERILGGGTGHVLDRGDLPALIAH